MSNQSETVLVKRYGRPLVYMTTGGLEYLVDRSGGDVKGFSLRLSAGDVLLIIRADFDGSPMVAFVGAVTGAGALVKAHHQLRNGGLKWRLDKYGE